MPESKNDLVTPKSALAITGLDHAARRRLCTAHRQGTFKAGFAP